jgi:hypothetical protein
VRSLRNVGQDSSVSVVTTLGSGWLRNRYLLRDGQKDFSLHRMQTGLVAHPGSYAISVRDSFCNDEVVAAWSWALTIQCSYIPLLPHTSSWLDDSVCAALFIYSPLIYSWRLQLFPSDFQSELPYVILKVWHPEGWNLLLYEISCQWRFMFRTYELWHCVHL